MYIYLEGMFGRPPTSLLYVPFFDNCAFQTMLLIDDNHLCLSVCELYPTIIIHAMVWFITLISKLSTIKMVYREKL